MTPSTTYKSPPFPYPTFTGKELDEETGYGYFGARYMDHELMMGWLSVDPMSDKYPNISPYAYCAWNPVKLVDPDGREIWIIGDDGNKYQYKNGKLYNQDGSKYKGNDDYSYKDADMVVTIGDDTTLIASDILYRFNTPIMGITDGDLDKVVESGFKTQGSVIFEVESGHDDIIGCEIFKLIFKSKKFIEIDKNQLKEEIINIINELDCKYIVNEI